MLDMNFLPDISGFLQSPGVSDIQVFTGLTASNGSDSMVWRKPRGKSMCNILCIGAGAGGGGGFTGVSIGAGGGAGGGSAGVTRVTLPLYFMPDTLYLIVGYGGIGGSGSGVAGAAGQRTNVLIYPGVDATNVYAISGNASAQGGAAGTNAGSATGGSAGTAATYTAMPLAGLGHADFIAGQIGASGGIDTGANGTAAALPTTSAVTMGGSGGAGVITAGTDFAGGGVTAIASSHLSMWAPIATAIGAFPGSAGPQLWKPLWSYSGLGGGGSVAGSGGPGGPGAYGSGGGGGGGGNVAGGAGGDGGSGLVIITCW